MKYNGETFNARSLGSAVIHIKPMNAPGALCGAGTKINTWMGTVDSADCKECIKLSRKESKK